MNKFKQYIPNFVDVDEQPEWIEFETTDDLLKLEIVQRHGEGKNFSHFAMSDNALMEISDDEFCWWVIGFVLDPTTINLPKWKGGKYRAELPNGSRVVLKNGEVVSSCGDILTLKNGTKAKDLRGQKC